MKKVFLVFLLSLFLLQTSTAQASQSKDFIMSVVYGTLAGTLVGAATLAFTSNPGDNLNNVARGASYGLYAGILLGLYVTYGLDESGSDDKKPSDDEEKSDKESRLKLRAFPPRGQLAQSDSALTLQPYLLPPPPTSHDWGVGVNFVRYQF